MKQVSIYNVTTKEVISSNAYVASSFFRRFLGLMGRKSIEEDFCLLIRPCNQVHMMNMRFSIDVVYLDEKDKVIGIDPGLQPWRIGKKRPKARAVLECHTSFTKNKIEIGDKLKVEC
jgi:uncharacterized membrane protein (UPF0127 family)